MEAELEPAGGKWEAAKETPSLLERGNISPKTEPKQTAYKHALLAKVSLHLILKEIQLVPEMPYVSTDRAFLNKCLFKFFNNFQLHLVTGGGLIYYYASIAEEF